MEQTLYIVEYNEGHGWRFAEQTYSIEDARKIARETLKANDDCQRTRVIVVLHEVK